MKTNSGAKLRSGTKEQMQRKAEHKINSEAKLRSGTKEQPHNKAEHKINSKAKLLSGTKEQPQRKAGGQIKLFTIGFTKKSAEKFFNLLMENGVERVADIRLNNTSQLAGFAKAEDLKYLLKAIGNIDYVYLPELAPSKEILEKYREDKKQWQEFEKKFQDLIAQREIESLDIKEILNGACLLCSEDKPDHCHRRIAAEYLKNKWGNVEIIHL